MSHTYFQNVMHVVFSTKEWRKIISAAMKQRLWSYTAAICQGQNVFVHAIGGMEEHIHLLLQFVRYIQDQERHHKKMSFEKEFIALLRKHGIEYDPRYVFG